MTSRTLLRCGSAIVFSLLLPACGVTDPAGDEDSLVGVWTTSVPDDYESHIEFSADGSFQVLDAYFGDQRCELMEGTWYVEGDYLHYTATSLNGQSYSESDSIAFTLSGNTLRTDVDNEPEIWTRTEAMATCADYGWPVVTLRADVDGQTMDFAASATLELEDGESIGDRAAMPGAWLDFYGIHRPDGASESCNECSLLSVVISWSSNSLQAGQTFSAAADDVSGFMAGATFTTLDDIYGYTSDGSDPGVQPWSGTVTITELGTDHIAGTFEFVVYRGVDPGPTVSSIAITNGVFSFDYR
jgi:uncharacterized protein (TIGR03066 family)